MSELVSRRYSLSAFSRLRGAYLVVNDEESFIHEGNEATQRVVRFMLLEKFIFRTKIANFRLYR
jgi:hypothetical protein